MITEIGIVAGEIWHYLDKHDEVGLSEMIKNIEKPRDTILMSLGWLAREGHVILKKSKGDFNVLLRRQPV
ncbi:MAG: winged helix-turn-helix domain-containing protein [Candidatus Omnitrophica bacterium]|nr:winged helix-turn-helix domain-containing protein [Candidatus Omnitrophota bacterium]